MLLTALVFYEVSGRLLTVAWGLEGIALLLAGFPMRERSLRLAGMALFFFCIGKLFLFDLRELETGYRILSFFVLGLLLLGASWVYTRFREQLKQVFMKKPALILILALLAGGGALVTLGKMDQKTDLSAVLELWGDALRDGDRLTLEATRVSDAREIRFGNEVRAQLPPDEPGWTPYVSAVGRTVAANVRRTGITYQFHAIDQPDVNAFAVPGGHIFVFTGMLQFLQSEAELAAILGHEISHVDQRHCIAKYQYQLAARKVGLDGMGHLADRARLPLTIAYSKNEELEADAQGVRLSIQAGYDPHAAPAVFGRMQTAFDGQAADRARTPQAVVVRTLAYGLVDYFRSHPSSEQRMARLEDLIGANHALLRGRRFYEGRSNYRNRISRAQHEDPPEFAVPAP